MKTDFLLSNIYIMIFILFWITKIVVYQKKKKIFDAGSILLFFYLFYAIMSLFLFNMAESEFNSIKLFPFIYLFSMLMLAFYPILRYDYTTIIKIQKPPNFIFNLVCIIFIIPSLLQIPEIISNFQESIFRLLLDSEGGQDMYNEAMAESTSLGNGVILNLPSIITNAYGNFGILLLFYYLTVNKRNKFILIGLFISCTIGFLVNITLGQRGPLAETLVVMIISYFTFRKFYQPIVNKIIKNIGIILLVLVAVPIIALTQSRFSDYKGGSNSSVIYYVGHENLYFNNYGLDNGGLRYGDRTFPLFKKMLGFENVPSNFWERRFKYPNLKINDEVFIGFVGDFTLDFGPFLTPFIFIFFIIFILNKTIVRNNVVYFHQLILLHFLMSICMIGGMKLYPFSDVGGNLQLIVYFIAYFVFKFSHLNNIIKSKPTSFS
jgi:oligosaccharide repeat unit polymerase